MLTLVNIGLVSSTSKVLFSGIVSNRLPTISSPFDNTIVFIPLPARIVYKYVYVVELTRSISSGLNDTETPEIAIFTLELLSIILSNTAVTVTLSFNLYGPGDE